MSFKNAEMTSTSTASKPLLSEDINHVIAHAGEDLQSLRGAKLFVTGGTGFFGKWIASTFTEANRAFRLDAEMLLLTREPERFRQECPGLVTDPSLSLWHGDVRNFEFPGNECTHIIHGASAPGKQPLELFDLIAGGTRRVLQFATERRVKRLLFLSSGAVYGPQPAGLTHIPETFVGAPDFLVPGSEYAVAKRTAEHFCAVLSRTGGFEATVARCFVFSGPYLALDSHFAIGNFIADVLAGRPIRVQGDGTAYRSYLYAADLAIWIWALLVRGEAGRAYNVGSDQAVTIAELANTVADVGGSELRVQIARQPVPGVDPQRYVPSIERARIELGLEPSIDLREGLRRTFGWLR